MEGKVFVTYLCPTLFNPMDYIAHQAPLSMEFSRREYWSGLPFPSLGDRSDPRIKPRSPTLQADSLPSEPPGNPHSTASFFFQVPRGAMLCQAVSLV